MALTPDTFESRPMVPHPAANVADHYLGPMETTLPPDFTEPKAFVLPPVEWEIFSARRQEIVKHEEFEAEHTGNYWLP